MAGDEGQRPIGTGAELAADDLACRRGERLVFSGLGFEVVAGELLLLRGRNGSGKSTLLRLIAGLIAPESGRLSWRGAAIEDWETFRREIAYLGHLDATKAELTAREDLQFWRAMRGGRPEACEAALARLGLEDLADIPARFLSAGQRRRLALARVLACGAALWLLDEPFNALDDAASGALMRSIEEHCTKGGLVVMAAHGAALAPMPSRVLDLDCLAQAGSA